MQDRSDSEIAHFSLIACGHQNRTAGALQARPGPQKGQVRTPDSQACACLQTDLRLQRNKLMRMNSMSHTKTPTGFRRDCDKILNLSLF